MYKYLKIFSLLLIPLFIILHSPATLSAFGGTGTKCSTLFCTGSIVGNFQIKPSPGNADNLGAVAVTTDIKVIDSDMWVFCTNNPEQGTYSGTAGADIEFVSFQSFTSGFAVCTPTTGPYCEGYPLSVILGVGGISALCPQQQNWALDDAVPQSFHARVRELHCFDADGALTACDSDLDGMAGPGVASVQQQDERFFDCSLTDAQFNEFEPDTSIPYACTDDMNPPF